MAGTQEAIQLTRDTTSVLLATLAGFSRDEFNRVPFAGSWTAAQVAEHLLKSRSGLMYIFSNDTTATGRQPDQQVRPLKELFLDYGQKMQSPVEILPSDGPHDRDEMIAALKQNADETLAAVEGMDLTETCMAFPFPGFGTLTRMEWLYFTAYHAQRHTQQLEKILAALRT